MKCLLTLLTVFSACVLVAGPMQQVLLGNKGSAAAPSSLLTDLAAYYKLDETSGTRADSTANAQDLADNNTVLYATGKQDNAADFEVDNSEFLSHADSATLSLSSDQDFTIWAWVYLESAVSAFHSGIVTKADWTESAVTEYQLIANSGFDRYRFIVGNGTTYGAVNADTYGAIQTGAWVFIVAWHDSTADTLNIQVNGGAVDSVSWTGGTQDGTNPFNIGAIGSARSYFDGLIDEAGLSKRVLTSDERAALYNTGSGTTHPF